MSDDEAFLRSLADHPNDDRLRLIYADWLDDRGDPRAEFLRVEVALREEQPDHATYTERCRREQELIRDLDWSWLCRVRRFTTPPPCRDIAALIPELAPFARTTIRLHPHRTMRDVPVEEAKLRPRNVLPPEVSKIGGRFLWPADEPWPTCETCGWPLVPVIQLRARDVPGVELPSGKNLFQLFWCPDEEAHGYQPALRVWWRDADQIVSCRGDVPDFTEFIERLRGEDACVIPVECALQPELVIEHLVWDDLRAVAGGVFSEQIGERIGALQLESDRDLADRWANGFDPWSLVFNELSQCPGTKLAGKPPYERDGRRYDHLLTLSTLEFDSGSFRRWIPVEDQRLVAQPGKQLTKARLPRGREANELFEATGMILGRHQAASVFVCRDVEPWEVIAWIGDS